MVRVLGLQQRGIDTPVIVYTGRSLDGAKLVKVGNSSRHFECTAYKLIQLVSPEDSAADVLPESVQKRTGASLTKETPELWRIGALKSSP